MRRTSNKSVDLFEREFGFAMSDKTFPSWIEKILETKKINRDRLEEYVLVYKPWNAHQCLSLIEGAEEIGQPELIKSILFVLLGTPSQLFIWKNENFVISHHYRLNSLNVDPLREFLKPFARLGTQYRTMWEWTERNYDQHGEIFNAFRLALRDLLAETSQHVFKARQYFFEDKKIDNQSMLRLPMIIRWLDSGEMGQIVSVIRMLWCVYQDVTKTPAGIPSVSDPNFIAEIQTINLKRIDCSQTLEAIYKRIFIPDRRIRGHVYTMLDRCLQVFFRIIQTHLASAKTLEKFNASELPFSSSHANEDEFYLHNYCPNEMTSFWKEFLELDLSQFQGLALFDAKNFEILVEAIKCSFALQRNGFPLRDCLKQINLMEAFRQELERLLVQHKHVDETFDIRTDCKMETLNCDINEYYRFPPLIWKHFQSYRLPIRLTLDINSIMVEALSSSFRNISQPIIDTYLGHVVKHYRCLFVGYANFYLGQHPQEFVQYVYFLFPALKNILLDRQFHRLGLLLRSIHMHDVSEHAPALKCFQPHLMEVEKLETFPDLLELSIGIFDHIFFTPKFEAETLEANGINFWPLTQMFNSNITKLYNQIYQFLIRLRFFMFIIGNDFILSSAFKSRDLSKNSYLFRFRQANLIIQFAQQVDWNLREMVNITVGRLDKITSFDELLEEHQRFLTRLEKIKTGLVSNKLMVTIFKSVFKFTLADHKDRRDLRSPSIQNALRRLDPIDPIDLYNHLLN